MIIGCSYLFLVGIYGLAANPQSLNWLEGINSVSINVVRCEVCLSGTGMVNLILA